MKFYILWYVSYCIAVHSPLTQSNKISVQPHTRTYSVFDQQEFIKLFSHIIKDTVGFLYIQLLKIIHEIVFIYGSASTWPPLSQPLCYALRGPDYKKQKSSTSVLLSHTIKLWCGFHTLAWEFEGYRGDLHECRKSSIMENWKTGGEFVYIIYKYYMHLNLSG